MSHLWIPVSWRRTLGKRETSTNLSWKLKMPQSFECMLLFMPYHWFFYQNRVARPYVANRKLPHTHINMVRWLDGHRRVCHRPERRRHEEQRGAGLKDRQLDVKTRKAPRLQVGNNCRNDCCQLFTACPPLLPLPSSISSTQHLNTVLDCSRGSKYSQ